jgi:cation diffusion facilitator CzcD-associated flavoprotein CzcO
VPTAASLNEPGTTVDSSGPATPPDYEIAVIGAGISGLGIGIALQDAGFDDYAIFERASDIGGTWRDNVYPGVGVDVPAQTYQFSFELKPDWSRVFAKGHEVQAYIDHVADRYGLRPRIRLDSDVTCRVWNAEKCVWELTVSGRTVTARYVIGATGPYVEPKLPDIAGLDEFQGRVLQSSRWEEGCDLTGERVGVVGTGASAVQFVPEIAPIVSRLDVYQRTPIWVVPKVDPGTPPWVERLFRRQPFVQDLVRRAILSFTEKLTTTLVLRFERRSTRTIVRALTWMLREVFYRRQLPDPDLRRRLTPDYGLWCKRPAISSIYLRTFLRPNVELVTDSIECITPRGIRTRDGREREIDTLILATGFHLATDPESYTARPVRGRDGFDLETFYREHRARSYEGISMPGLPNHFMVVGAYGVAGSTWHAIPEAAGIHIVRVLRAARARGAQCIEPREEATERWSALMRQRLERSLIKRNSCETARSFYIDRNGDVAMLRATSGKQSFIDHATFPLEDYMFSSGPAADRDARAHPSPTNVRAPVAGG